MGFARREFGFFFACRRYLKTIMQNGSFGCSWEELGGRVGYVGFIKYFPRLRQVKAGNSI